ncbi:MAG: UDP-N-acetylmuramate--L-alanine ligase [Synergistaceae bacterium]|nr:UDP-N-acetylmuramate--L-alanine ligase [Synergistaceae bacterium]
MFQADKIKRVHLMGIGGAGMSALSLLLKAQGLEVSGCDLCQPHYDLGDIPCEIPHSAEHIGRYSPDALILSTAVSRENPEVLLAEQKGIPVFSRAEALSSLFNKSYGIGIAGTHGKTTTTSMTALIFLKAGLNPTVYVGANVPDIGSNAVAGSGSPENHFIAELDESDGSFLLFTPKIAVITNADWDHVDHYPTRGHVIEAFTRFADGRKDGGALILCGEDEGASHVYENCRKNHGQIIRYGWGKGHDWGAYDIVKSHGGGISCKVAHSGKELGTLSLSVSGEHNILNALAAISSADLCGIDFSQSAEILHGFHGSERRLQVLGSSVNDILVIDDYAHHPAEINATLSAVKGIYPERRLVILFQPHRFSRTAAFAPQTASALSAANPAKVFILPVFSAGEIPSQHSSSLEILRHAASPVFTAAESLDDACAKLLDELRTGDLLITMGAGNVYLAGKKILASLDV